MDFPELFEGPGDTLFLLEGLNLRIISADGEEALVALVDFLAFLLHLTACRVLIQTNRAEKLQRALAALIS
jgi:hypothetical protein